MEVAVVELEKVELVVVEVELVVEADRGVPVTTS